MSVAISLLFFSDVAEIWLADSLYVIIFYSIFIYSPAVVHGLIGCYEYCVSIARAGMSPYIAREEYRANALSSY